MRRIASTSRRGSSATALAVLLIAASSGCRVDMQDQPRYEPNSPSHFFPDGTSVRPLVPGVVARDTLVDDPTLEQGEAGGKPIAHIPLPLDQALVTRGR